MAKRYYSLCIFWKDSERFSLEFGDYDKQTVLDEAADLIMGSMGDDIVQYKVISTKDDQASINAAVDKLNATLKGA